MPNVYIEPVPKAAQREARSRTSWQRITPTTSSRLSRHRKKPSTERVRTTTPACRAVRHLNDKKIPSTGAPPSPCGTSFLSDRSFEAS